MSEPNLLFGRRVMLVEDEYFIADDLTKALQKVGAEVIGPVPAVGKALSLLASDQRIDAAVLDINLQGEAVFPIADALVERGIPFAFATGYGQGEIPAKFEGVLRWEKPFEPAEIARGLIGLLRSP